MNIPKVAVITRTKDRGVLLERAIKSVHQQTLIDLIHVIINDSGDPGVVDVLVEKYKDIIKGRVKVIHNKVSHGMEAASNKAIKSVESEFIAIHDDDDSWHPRFLEQLVGHIEEVNGMGAIARTQRVYESVEAETVRILNRDEYMPHLSHFSLYDLFAENFAVPISFLYRRSVYEKIGYYNEELMVTGDWDFGLRFMREYDIDKVDPGYALSFYHIRPSNKGIMGNSIFDPNKAHARYHTMLANRFLREDLDSGGLGFGYLFNVANTERDKKWKLEEIQKELEKASVRIDQQTELIESTRFNIRKIDSMLREKTKHTLRRIKHKIRRG